MVIVIVATRSLGTPGDYDEDGDVDGADLIVLQQGYGTIYNDTHFAEWQSNFGFTSFGATTAIPEPSGLILTLMLGLVPWRWGRLI